MRRFHRLILICVLAVVRSPRKSLIVACAIALLCGGLAIWKLQISTDQDKLFDPDVKFFKDYLAFGKTFPENDALYVVIDAADSSHPPMVKEWAAIADAIVARLRAMPNAVKSAEAKIPTDELGSQGLLFDAPDRVHQSFEDFKRFIPLVQLWGEKPGLLTGLLGSSPLERFIAALNTQKPDVEIGDFVAMVAGSLNEALAHPSEPLRPGHGLPDLDAAGAEDPSRLGYYYVPDDSDPSKHLLLVRVFERAQYAAMTELSDTVDAIRNASLAVGKEFPQFRVGISGRPALEADEMKTTDVDSHRAEVVALIAVFVGLVVVLRSVWLAVAGELSLIVGIGWTFGWATVSIGELNLLSIVFLLALIGIGMDYLVQILTRYRQEIRRRTHNDAIWVSVFRHVAPPINTACAGAAGAFLVAALTHFRGAAQLGIIAGGGLLLCLTAGYVVLPALLTIWPIKQKVDPKPAVLGPAARSGKLSFLWPLAWAILLAAGIPFSMRTGFDPNLLGMQAQNLQSVKLVRRLQTWSAAVISNDLSTLRTVRDAVEAKAGNVVGRTESLVDAVDNLRWLGAHEKELPVINWVEPNAISAGDLGRLKGKAEDLAKKLPDARPQLMTFAAAVSGAEAEKIAARLSEWQRAFIEQLKASVAPFHPSDLDVKALPAGLRDHYVGTDKTFALYLYPKKDLWVQANLAEFVKTLEPIIKPLPGEFTFTGIAPNVYHSTASIENSFYHATAYALALILFLVFIDLKNIRDTLAAVSVLALGLPMLAALMGLMKVDWNFANFFGLPILIGAGHEYGVFLVHRYREAKEDARRVWRRWDVSDRALLLCAYVTCSSFGFFWLIAHHRGLKSLGLVMTLGTACIYLSALLVLRPILIWRLARQQRKTYSQPTSAS